MKLIRTLFQKHTDTLKRAMAFVDYEHWYYSYQNLYGIRPQISAWRKELEASFNLTDILVFGDFSQTPINQELPKIRSGKPPAPS